MKIFILPILILLPSVALSAPRGHGVGNGGDGYYYRSTKKVVLRDLLETGLAKVAIDSAGAKTTRFTAREYPLLASESERTKLAVKLTEINSALPGFGDVLARVMDQYAWVFVDVPLALVEHQDNVIGEVSGAELRQLANRLGLVIRVHGPSWNLMNAENRIALILHEVIEALLTPKPGHNSGLTQSTLKARELTSLLFMPDLLDRSSLILKTAFEGEMNLPWWQLEGFSKAQSPYFIEIENAQERQNRTAPGTKSERAKLAKELCAAQSSFEIRAHGRPYQILISKYESDFGPQLYSVLKEHDIEALQASIDIKSPSCLLETSRALLKIYSQQ